MAQPADRRHQRPRPSAQGRGTQDQRRRASRVDRGEPAAPDEGARLRPHGLQPARQLHGPSHRRFRCQFDLGLDLQRALLPRLEVVSRPFHRRGDAAAESWRRSEDLHSRTGKMRPGLWLRRHQPQPRSVRRPLDEPAADRPLVVSDLREDGGMGHPGDGACLDELQSRFPHHRRPLHQRRHDRGDAVHSRSAVQGFPDAALRRSARRRRRALSLGPLSRARAGTEEAAPHRAAARRTCSSTPASIISRASTS